MINFIHCLECQVQSEIRTDDDEIYIEPRFCPFCGYCEDPDPDLDDEDSI